MVSRYWRHLKRNQNNFAYPNTNLNWKASFVMRIVSNVNKTSIDFEKYTFRNCCRWVTFKFTPTNTNCFLAVKYGRIPKKVKARLIAEKMQQTMR